MALGFAEYADLDGLALGALIGSGGISATEAMQTALAAIGKLNPTINAVTRTMRPQAEAAIAAGLPQGPFQGVPFLVKDLIQTVANVPTDGGSRFFMGVVRPYDSELVRRWKAAGLVMLGKTNTPECASSGSTEPVATGATHNPWALGHTPGGSSGGAAAAVAAGIVPAAQASDAGGSIRGPASCCGLVGLKPTRGRISLAPDAGEVWQGLNVEHVVSRSLRDSAALLDVSAGYCPGDPYTAPPPARPFLAEVGADPGRLRIGVSLNEAVGKRFDPDAAEAVARAARLLEGFGHHVEEAAPAFDAALLGEAFMVFFAAAVGASIDAHALATGQTPSNDLLERNNLWLWRKSKDIRALDYMRAVDRMNTVSRQYAQFFTTHDIWLTPTMAEPPPKLGHLYADVDDVDEFFRRLWLFNPMNSISNASGHPAISLPLHWNAEGLPIGVMLGAGFAREAVLLQVSAQLEAACPWRDRHPPVSAWNL